MGCWSESCALSGLEIGAGDEIFVALISENKYRKGEMELASVPVRGNYDDYGGIDLLEDHPSMKLKKGDNWRPVEDGIPMFMNAKVVDWLEYIKPDFPYAYLNGQSVKISTLGHQIDIHIENIRNTLEEALAQQKKFDGTTRGLVALNVAMSDLHLKNSDRKMLEAIIEETTSETRDAELEKFYELYRRSAIVTNAFIELRKNMSGGLSNGPQHGGAQALVPFYELVLDIAKKDLEQWDNGD